MSERPLYTQQQLQEYFGYVGFSKGDQDVIAGNGNIADRLESLARLIRMQMSNIPFENLDIHYSNHHSVSLDVGHLYDKFVRRKDGRGGYCMENNTFFGTVLRSLGFDVMACGGRVTDVAAAMKPHAKSSSVSFRSWGHMVNIVTIADERYLIDVGFGNNAPTFAVPLMDGFTSLNTGNENGGSYLRLTREHIPDNTHRGTAQLLWVYSVRFSTSGPWIPCYCFSEIEFLPADFEVMSYFVSTNPRSWFTQNIVCSRLLLDDTSDMVIGDVTLSNSIMKERRYGKSKVVLRCQTEEDRIRGLQDLLGVWLQQNECRAICGLQTALPAT